MRLSGMPTESGLMHVTLIHEFALKICSPCSRLAFEMKLSAAGIQVSTGVQFLNFFKELIFRHPK